MLIDTHAHLQDIKFSRDLDSVLLRARDAGIQRIVCIADDMATSRQAMMLAKRHASLFSTAGVHPHNERGFRDEALDEIRKLAKSKKLVAVGEIGLDYHYPDYRKGPQTEVFMKQAALASELELPMVIHCRDAYPDLIGIFREYAKLTSRGVVHCFSGTYEEAVALLDLGFFLGFGGAITYPNAGALRETLKRIGLDRVVTETDSPYLPPQTRRGRRNEPSYMKFSVAEIAKITGFTYQDVARITTANAVRLYGMKDEAAPEIAYSVRRRMYLNITNRCTNDCCFCERTTDYKVFGHYLKLDGEPTAQEILNAIEEPERFEEFVICGLGEPTLRLDVVLEVARALKEKGVRVRLNTNGHGNMIHGRDITPDFTGVLDSVSIMMNGHDQEAYNRVSCPADPVKSFDAMMDFARRVRKHVPDVRMKLIATPDADIEACRQIAEDDLQLRFQMYSPQSRAHASAAG